MTTLNDKLTRIKNCKTDIAAAIHDKGIPSEGVCFAEYADLIGQINGSGSSPSKSWEKPVDWPDIKSILANDTLPSGYVSSYIQLLSAEDKLFSLNRSSAYRFSDAPDAVVTNSSANHVWDASKDFPCSAGYKTRWVISYFKTDLVSTAVDKNAIFCVFRCIFTSNFKKMKLLEAVDCLDSYYLKPSTAMSMFESDYVLKKVPARIDLANCTDTTGMFYKCYKLTNVPRQLDLSNCRQAISMFYDCHSLEKLPTVLDLSACTNAENMFCSCYSLVKLPNINEMTSCTNASFMFKDCYSLVGIPESFSLPSCTDANNMFAYCRSLKKVPVHFSLPVCKNARSMFCNCSSLGRGPVTLDLPACTSAADMFLGCNSLIKGPDNLDLSNCTNTDRIFSSCYNLRSIHIQNLKTSISFSDMNFLSKDSLLSILNSLKTVTGQTLTLGSSLLGKLTAEDKAIATSKGWTLA